MLIQAAARKVHMLPHTPRCGCFLVRRFVEAKFDRHDTDDVMERLSLSGISHAVMYAIRADSIKYTADNDHITVDAGTV